MIKLTNTSVSLVAAVTGMVLGAVAHFAMPTSVSAAVSGDYPGTLFQEVGTENYKCDCGAKNCTPCS